MTAVAWCPSAITFGTLGGLIGRAVGGEPLFLAGLIAGALVLPVGCVCSGIVGLREVRRRAELYSQGQLLPGRVTGCAASEHYYCDPSNPDAMPVRSGYVLTVRYCFQAPAGRCIEDKAQTIYPEVPRPWPDGETPVVVLYLDDDRYELL